MAACIEVLIPAWTKKTEAISDATHAYKENMREIAKRYCVAEKDLHDTAHAAFSRFGDAVALAEEEWLAAYNRARAAYDAEYMRILFPSAVKEAA